MSDEIEFDLSGLRNLAADLGKIPDEATRNVRKAVEVTARNVKNDWRSNARSRNRAAAKGYPYAIDYDMKLSDGQIAAEIGPDLGKNQGSLGFLEEAPGGVRNAPQGNARRALAKNVEDFQIGLRKALPGVTDAGGV